MKPFDAPIRQEQCGPVRILRLDGDLEARCVPPVRAAAGVALDAGVRVLALDFSGVPFLEEDGIALLLWIARHAHERDARAVLVGVAGQPRQRIERCRLAAILPCLTEPELPDT